MEQISMQDLGGNGWMFATHSFTIYTFEQISNLESNCGHRNERPGNPERNRKQTKSDFTRYVFIVVEYLKKSLKHLTIFLMSTWWGDYKKYAARNSHDDL